MEHEVFEKGKVSGVYLKLAFPLVLSMAVALVYNLADTFFVARTNDTKHVTGLSFGGQPLFGYFFGSGNREKPSQLTILFQSAGKILGSFLLSISRQGVVFFAVLALSAHAAGYHGILAAQAVADLVSAGLALALFRCQLYHEIW